MRIICYSIIGEATREKANTDGKDEHRENTIFEDQTIRSAWDEEREE